MTSTKAWAADHHAVIRQDTYFNIMVGMPHIVELQCTCLDIEHCHTLDLAADRDRGWKEAFRMQGVIHELQDRIRMATYLGSDPT